MTAILREEEQNFTQNFAYGERIKIVLFCFSFSFGQLLIRVKINPKLKEKQESLEEEKCENIQYLIKENWQEKHEAALLKAQQRSCQKCCKWRTIINHSSFFVVVVGFFSPTEISPCTLRYDNCTSAALTHVTMRLLNFKQSPVS